MLNRSVKSSYTGKVGIVRKLTQNKKFALVDFSDSHGIEFRWAILENLKLIKR